MGSKATLSNTDIGVLTDEVLKILNDAMETLDDVAQRRNSLPVYVRNQKVHEESQVILRLTRVVTWLNCYKAFRQNDLSQTQLVEQAPDLSDCGICWSGPDGSVELPAETQELVERSHAFYLRVLSLDRNLRT